jgi:amidohydrolase
MNQIASTIRKYAEQVRPVARAIHQHPELGFEEHEACRLQVELLRAAGFRVTTPYGGLDTAYRAEFGTGEPVFAVMCEYDALPQLGHACGHNLICGAGLAAGLALCELMESDGIAGKIVVLGTPAEETLGGKVILLEQGGFEDIDACILCHPASVNALDSGDLAVSRFDVTFRGHAAHAAAAPYLGVNALDAMNLFFAGIACWRQQLPPGGMVHGVISQGGTAPNIIPDYTEAFFYLRSRDNATQGALEVRLDEIARGAALMTGCGYTAVRRPNPYSADRPNPPLREAVLTSMDDLRMNPDREYRSSISTDYANVSLVVPGVNFFFNITGGRAVALHSAEFERLAGSDAAFESAMDAAGVMAAVGLRFLTEPDFRRTVTGAE